MKHLIGLLIAGVLSCTAYAAESPTRRALILCGLPGDAEHQEQFVDSVEKIQAALVDRFGFDADDVRVQFGRSEDAPAIEGLTDTGRATKEEIAAEAKWLTETTGDSDTAWVFVIGHAYFDGRKAFLNVPDQDISHPDFAKLFSNLGGQSVFFVCTPVSGYYIKELSQPNRIIVSATAADEETNGSIFHTAIATALTDITVEESFDQDKNGNVSLLDLYIQSTQNLANLYLENDPPLIATEHPQIDDNGDGRGSELQIDYLTIAQGGRKDAKRKRRFRRFKDGAVAAKLPLNFVP